MNEKKLNSKPVELPVMIPSETPKIYATGAFGGVSAVDFKIFFFSEEPVQQDEPFDPVKLKVMREVKAQISLSPLAAKQVAVWLTKQIEIYEKQIGPINIPITDSDKREKDTSI
ncbi:MAG: DUF3467 domain-containing protein [Methanobacteriaceae archaeon]|jgi:hypothetical protein|nr:DUF3467 domain-containing protein [Methanobacteriaceae archaeon]